MARWDTIGWALGIIKKIRGPQEEGPPLDPEEEDPEELNIDSIIREQKEKEEIQREIDRERALEIYEEMERQKQLEIEEAKDREIEAMIRAKQNWRSQAAEKEKSRKIRRQAHGPRKLKDMRKKEEEVEQEGATDPADANP